MKPRLSKDEYLELGRRSKKLHHECSEIHRIVVQHFPKKSRAYKLANAILNPLFKLYYQLETEFLRDYPDMEVTDYGK